MRLFRSAGLLASMLMIAGCATIVVERVTSAGSDGLIYALPNTVLRVQLKLNQTVKSGAPYAAYAAIFAPDSHPVCRDAACSGLPKASYAVESGATFSTYGEPDPANVYFVKFTGGRAVDQTLSMTWNEAGLLTAASSSVTNRSTDIAMSGVKLLTAVGTKAAFGAVSARAGVNPQCPDKSTTDDWVLPLLHPAAAQVQSTLIGNYCALKKSDRDALPRDDRLFDAALAAYIAKVQPLVHVKGAILDGTSQTLDQTALLTKLETEIDQELTELYVGKTVTQSWDGTIDVRKLAVDSPLSILAVDANKGFCLREAAIPPDAKPLPPQFDRLNATDCTGAANVVLHTHYYPDPALQLFSMVTDKGEGQRSFRYRVPAQVSVTIDDDKGKVYGAGVVRVAQLGTVMSLPAQRHSKSLSYDLTFVEATGALKSFKLGTTGGLDSSTIDALSGAGGTVLDAENAAKKNEQEAAVLTRQDQLLKLRDDICTIQAKYGIKCTIAP
jgi:hypothetical protein